MARFFRFGQLQFNNTQYCIGKDAHGNGSKYYAKKLIHGVERVLAQSFFNPIYTY